MLRRVHAQQKDSALYLDEELDTQWLKKRREKERERESEHFGKLWMNKIVTNLIDQNKNLSMIKKMDFYLIYIYDFCVYLKILSKELCFIEAFS